MTPLNLICFYTSGIKPLNSAGVLPNHDDWGLKYMREGDNSPMIRWQQKCENLYLEAKVFLKEENEGVFTRHWQENDKKHLAIAIVALEKGSMRRNVLVGIFETSHNFLPKEIAHISFADKFLPAGLKEIKRNPQIEISIQDNSAYFPIMTKLGEPVEPPKKDLNRTTTSHVPVPMKKRRSGSLAWAVAFAMAIIAILPYTQDTGSNPMSTSMTTAMQPHFSSRVDRTADLESENIELRQKLDTANAKLRERMYELEEKDSVVTEIGGWESLKVLVNISKKYRIDRAEKLQLVFDKFKREIEQLKREKSTSQNKYNNQKEKMKYIKFNLQKLHELVEQELTTSNGSNWKLSLRHCKKEIQDLLENE
ncbi:hypothetical protein [Candidatus Uabimicrobium sp. HlEnr_7]|uniref:hypothetical protein n=1 Tax=Candidatus Uabimicrobium helgolandensis TaxID=3095367 RepID=UPI0035587F16